MTEIAALRARGHDILATQLWLARRYPDCAALRAIIKQNVERLGGAL